MISRRAVINPVEIKQVFAKCDPSEKKQILMFVGLKPRERLGEFLHFEHQVHYFLMEMRDLDTGRKFYAAGLDVEVGALGHDGSASSGSSGSSADGMGGRKAGGRKGKQKPKAGAKGITRPEMMKLLGLEVPAVLVKGIARCRAEAAQRESAQRKLQPRKRRS